MHGFIRVLVVQLYLALELLIAVGISFSQIIDHVRDIKGTTIETYRGYDKRPCNQYSATAILSRSEDPLGRGQFYLHAIDST